MPVVRAMRSKLGAKLEHDPATIDTREDRVDRMNTTYLDINNDQDWLHLQIEADWNVYYNRTGTNTTFSVSVVAGSHLVTFSGSVGFLFEVNAGGMIFTDGVNDAIKYTINRFATTTTAYLDIPYGGATNVALTTWTIAAERFYLPVDCARALGFIDRVNGRGRLTILDRRREEQYLSWTGDNEGEVYFLVDDDTVAHRAPDPGDSATDSTAAGTLFANSVYETCYTFDYQGYESPASVPNRVTTSSSANHQIVLAALEDTTDGGQPVGINKKVYLRLLTKAGAAVYGRWLLADTLGDATTTTTISTAPLPTAPVMVPCYERKYMRTEWAPGADATLRLRYMAKPPRLVADSDVPFKWPEAYHDLIVLGAAIDLGLTQGAAIGKIAEWQRQYDKLYKAFKKAMLIVPDSPSVKQVRAEVGYGVFPYLTNGAPTTDFYGG